LPAVEWFSIRPIRLAQALLWSSMQNPVATLCAVYLFGKWLNRRRNSPTK
jgi:hypothetical protein